MPSMHPPSRAVVKGEEGPPDAPGAEAPAVTGPAETDVTAQPVHLTWVHGETHPSNDLPVSDFHLRTIDGLPVA